MKPIEMLDRLRKGEKVTCTICNKGTLKPVGNTNFETTHCFKCDSCAAMMNIDYSTVCRSQIAKNDKTIHIDDRPIDAKIEEYEQKNGELKPLTDEEKKEYGI